MSRVVHFEIPLKNPEKTGQFYQAVFGWKIQKWDGPMEYWMVSTGDKSTPGIDGGLMRADQRFTHTINTMYVVSVDASIKHIETQGGKVVIPKMAIPGVGYMAYASDPEGNMFGIMEMDEHAK